MFSKKATKFDKIFTVDLTLTTYCQIDGENFVNFCGLLRKHELYVHIRHNIRSRLIKEFFKNSVVILIIHSQIWALPDIFSRLLGMTGKWELDMTIIRKE